MGGATSRTAARPETIDVRVTRTERREIEEATVTSFVPSASSFAAGSARDEMPAATVDRPGTPNDSFGFASGFGGSRMPEGNGRGEDDVASPRDPSLDALPGFRPADRLAEPVAAPPRAAELSSREAEPVPTPDSRPGIFGRLVDSVFGREIKRETIRETVRERTSGPDDAVLPSGSATAPRDYDPTLLQQQPPSGAPPSGAGDQADAEQRRTFLDAERLRKKDEDEKKGQL